MTQLAEHMAEGCPSLTDAAYRMRLPIAATERLWKAICRSLGPQAR